MKEPSNYKFENSISELEAMIETIEKDEANIEQSLKAFEKGVELVRSAQKYLGEAQQKVTSLTEDADNPVTVDFPEAGE